VVRLLRVVRLIKAGRHSMMMQTFVQAVAKGRDGVVFLMFLLTIFSVLFGTLVFYAETSICQPVAWILNDAGTGYLRKLDGSLLVIENPVEYLEWGNGTYTLDQMLLLWVYKEDLPVDAIRKGEPTGFQSIPRSMWWCLVTLTTVGYGDIYPVTGVGKMLASITMVVALVAIAFPVTVLGNSFIDVATEFQQKKKSVEAVLAANKLKNTFEDTQLLQMDLEEEIQQTVERLNELTVWRMYHQQNALTGKDFVIGSVPKKQRRRTVVSASDQPPPEPPATRATS